MRIDLLHSFRRLFVFSLVWFLVEGIFRKWILPGLSAELFVAKYLLFSTLYVMYFLRLGILSRISHSYHLFLLALIIWCLFEFIYNSDGVPILIPTMGLVLYTFYIPFTAVIPAFFRKVDLINNLIKWLGIISIPIFILGMLQYFLPADHIINAHTINKISEEEQGKTVVGDYIRCMSIFSFVKIYSLYLNFVLNIFFGKIILLLYEKKKVAFFLIVALLGSVNLIMTASRLQIFLVALNLIIYIIYFVVVINKNTSGVLSFFSIFIVIGIIGYLSNNTVKTAVDSFAKRIEMTESLGKKLEGYSALDRTIDRLDIFKYSEEAGLIGFGIGVTYQGTGFYLTKIRPEIKFEEEGERIILEIGIIGGIIVILLRLAILVHCFRVLFFVKSITLNLMILPFILQMVPSSMFLSTFTFNYMDNFLYWFSFGMVLSIKKIYINSHQSENLIATS